MIRWLLLILGLFTLIQTLRISRKQGAFMAQLDDLNNALDSISTEVSKIATEQQTLIDQLQKANENPAVDLSGAIAKAQGIADSLKKIDDLVPDAPVITDTPTA